jgi:hypothetical protein
MYVLASDQTVEIYPYSIDDLRRDNPNTSYPRNPSDATLADWNVFPVTDKPAPNFNPATQNCNQINPTLKAGTWEMAWAVTPATLQEITERTSAKEAEVRQQRNALLNDCDWTQLPGTPVSPAPWAEYRQQLRDVTAQVGFPWEVVWPVAPLD